MPSSPDPFGSPFAPATGRAYRAAWRAFVAWCQGYGRASLPAEPDTLAEFFRTEAPAYVYSTARRVWRAVELAHRAAGYESPTDSEQAREAWSRLLSADSPLREPPERLATAQEVDLARCVSLSLRGILRALPDNELGVRDRALLLAGATGSLSRAELVGLRWEDIERQGDGTALRVHSHGAVRSVVVRSTESELDLGGALEAWGRVQTEKQGAQSAPSNPVFTALDRHGKLGTKPLSPQAVTVVLRRAASAAGLPATAASTELFGRP